MTRIASRRWLSALAAATVVAALVVIVRAAIPDAGGVIHACYANNNGALRVVDDPSTCKITETAVAWSQIGPQGPQGPQGPIGPQGPQGPPGAVQAFVAETTSQVIEGDWEELIGLTGLPAGNYVLWITIQVRGDDNDFPAVCNLNVNDAAIAGLPLTVFSDGHGSYGVIPTMRPLTLSTADSSVKVVCAGGDDPTLTADMTAVKVG